MHFVSLVYDFHQINLLNIHKKLCLFCFHILIFSLFVTIIAQNGHGYNIQF